MQRAVDGDNITLSEHLLKAVNATAANLLLDLGAQGLVVVVEQLLAVEGLQAAEHTLTDTANSDSTDNLALQVVLILGDSSDIPVTVADLVVSGDEVADQEEDGHDDVLSDGDNVGTGDLGHGNTTVGLVGGIEINVVGANTGSHSKLQLLGLGQTLSGEVSRVEAIQVLADIAQLQRLRGGERSSDDDLGVNQLLVEGRVLALLVGSGHQGVTGVLEPLANTELILSGTQKTGLLLGVLATLENESAI